MPMYDGPHMSICMLLLERRNLTRGVSVPDKETYTQAAPGLKASAGVEDVQAQ
jgi:hypothetical protein